MNIKILRYIYLSIIAFVAFSIIGLFQWLQSMGLMLGFDTNVIFMPLKYFMFLGLAWIFYKISKGEMI